MNSHVSSASAAGRIFGVRLPVDHEEVSPWIVPPSRRRDLPPVEGELPKSVEAILGDRVYVDRSALPPALVARLTRLAAFKNPDFYAAQAMRLPTYGKPRVISCAELLERHVALPREAASPATT